VEQIPVVEVVLVVILLADMVEEVTLVHRGAVV